MFYKVPTINLMFVDKLWDTELIDTTFTSREHGKLEPQSLSHCGSFDHPNLQSVNHSKGIFKTYLAVYYMPPNSQNYNW